MSDDNDDGKPPFDENKAQFLCGKNLLVGLTFLNNNDEIKSRKQFFGIVKSVSEREGIVILLQGNSFGKTYTLPPDLRSLQKAAPGEYRLRETGETVVDPDYLMTWNIYLEDSE